MKLYLASTSPRRRELLSTLGLPFEVVVPQFIEMPTELSPEEEVLCFAEQKARSVAAGLSPAWIIGSDTLVVCDGLKLGKPVDAADAIAMLTRLSGRTHEVLTSIALLNTADGSLKTAVDVACVRFHSLTQAQIRLYVSTGEPMDKAGAYAVQGQGRDLIAGVEGDEETVIGLPTAILRRWLEVARRST